MTNFRIQMEWQGFGGNFPRDESVGRWQSFSLSFHLADLVLVGTISVTHHQFN